MARRKRDMTHGIEANQPARRPLQTARRAQRTWLETEAIRASRRFIAPRIPLRLCARNGLLTQWPGAAPNLGENHCEYGQTFFYLVIHFLAMSKNCLPKTRQAGLQSR